MSTPAGGARGPRPARSRPVLLALATALGLSLGSCHVFHWRTQVWPKPMKSRVETLPPGEAEMHPAGPEEVTIVRHADPVQVRPAGHLSGFPMHFYEKAIRVSSGSSVIVSSGGRAEVLWPGGTSIVLYGQGVGTVGSPSRGEPTLEFQDVERARMDLLEGDRVRLLGGAMLSGDSGPYLVERVSRGVLQVRNQSKAPVEVAFRDAIIELGPGQRVDLPLLSSGGAPLADGEEPESIAGPGFSVLVSGEVETRSDGSGVHLRALEEGEATGLGVVVRLEEGGEVLFHGLEATPSSEPETPPDSAAVEETVRAEPAARPSPPPAGGGSPPRP